MLGVDVAETQQDAETFVANFGVTFPVLLDTQGGVFNQYRPPAGACTSPYPLDFVIDREGVIRYWKCEYDAPAMIATIENLLTGGIGVPEPLDVPAADRLPLGAAPNPFHPFTRLTYTLSERGAARLSVHDAQGRVVRVLAAGVEDAGTHHLLWDGRNAAGRQVASGVYYVRLRVPGGEASQKLILTR